FLLSSSFLFLLTPRTPRSTLFPYTTLFRSRDNRSFFYPSVSASFVFTEIEGLQSDVLNFGKLRASYAEVGQAGNYYDSFYSVPTYGGGFSSGTPIIYPLGSVVSFTPSTTLYDPALRPQNTKAIEVGTDLTFYRGLFDLSYTF